MVPSPLLKFRVLAAALFPLEAVLHKGVTSEVIPSPLPSKGMVSDELRVIGDE
jgi:hypothetical protein